MVRKLLGPAVLALVFPVILAAQSQATTGVIRGTVTDPSGTAVAGASVVLRETQRTGVRLGVGETVNLTLPLAAVQLQAVVVEARQPVVDATRVENSTSLPDAAVSRL